METDYKRPKEIKSKTEAISLSSCGTLHLTIGYLDEIDDVYGRVTEIRAVIGKGGVPCNILLDSWAKAMSMLLQSPMPRYKIIEKIKKQFIGVVCTNQKQSCVNEIAVRLLKELE
jgi:hypothetical protein